jgi:sugar phosphate isomerase/epimerase
MPTDAALSTGTTDYPAPDAPRYSFIVIERLADLGEDALSMRLRLLADLGYRGAEFQLGRPQGIDLDRLERFLDDCRLVVPSFLTGEAYSDGLCLCSPDPSIRKETVNRLIGYLPTVRRFKAVMVVGLLQGRPSDEANLELAVARIEDCLKRVADAAEGAGVDVVIEPVNHLQVGFHNSVSEVRALIARIDSRALRPMVDTVQMNIEEDSLTNPIRECGASLRHVHLCESHGGRFGTGRVDFPAVLGTLKQIGYREW